MNAAGQMQTETREKVDRVALSDNDFKRALTDVAPHLRAFARALCGSRDHADDLAQETMLRAWAARERYAAGTNFKAWTFTILRNHFYSEARRSRFHGEYDEAVAERTLAERRVPDGTLTTQKNGRLPPFPEMPIASPSATSAPPAPV